MEWIQATSRPCHHHRFPIRIVRRPPPSGTPPSLEQTFQPQTTLMNWRCVRIELLVPRCVKRICKIDSFAVPADFHHLRSAVERCGRILRVSRSAHYTTNLNDR